MSRRRKIIITVLASVVFIVVAVSVLRREREPSYEGRPLTFWVMVLSRTDTATFETAHAEMAIRQIGTNAIPLLLQWIQYDNGSDPGLAWRINAALAWITDKVSSTGNNRILDRRLDLAVGASRAFGCLGKTASSAVSELVRLLDNPKSHWVTTGNAAEALARIGETGVPAILAILNDTNSLAHLTVIANVHHFETNALPIVPLLIQILLSDTEFEPGFAASALGKLALEPGTVVPALTTSLSSTNNGTVEDAAEALGRFRSLARPAIPSLTNLFTSTNRAVRFSATNALHAIDPIVFTNKIVYPFD